MMQEEEPGYYTLSLTQKAYIIAKSLRAASYWLLILTLSLFFFSLLALISWYNNITSRTDSSNSTGWFLIVIILIATYIVGWFIIKGRYEYRRLNEWNEEYLHSSYTLIFDTTIPRGNSTGEKILNLAKLVFPELRPTFSTSILDEPSSSAFVSALVRKLLKKNRNKSEDTVITESKIFQVDSYKFDLALKTKVGYFVVKDFENKIVTIEDLHELSRICNKNLKDVFRIICVAKKYDTPFLNRGSLERLMNEDEKLNFKIDLLVVEENGYSVLWIS
jgi:hypothetical protein